MVRPSLRPVMARHAVNTARTSIRHACDTFAISETCNRYLGTRSTVHDEIADGLVGLTTTYRTWGFGRCLLYARNVNAFGWNHRRVYRLNRRPELNLRLKPHRRLVRETPQPLAIPAAINDGWSMDFIPDQRRDGRSVRLFNVLDDFNREVLSIYVDRSLPAARVMRALDQIIEWRGPSKRIRCDNGPERSL